MESPMPHETDLPCSNCGAELVESIEAVPDAATGDANAETVTVAECPACGARFYPRDSLEPLSAISEGPRQPGEF